MDSTVARKDCNVDQTKREKCQCTMIMIKDKYWPGTDCITQNESRKNLKKNQKIRKYTNIEGKYYKILKCVEINSSLDQCIERQRKGKASWYTVKIL